MMCFHIFQLDLNTWQIGLMFLIAPGIYAFTAPLWGWITDSKVREDNLLTQNE